MFLSPEKGQRHFNVTQLTQLLTGSQCLPDQLLLNSVITYNKLYAGEVHTEYLLCDRKTRTHITF